MVADTGCSAGKLGGIGGFFLCAGGKLDWVCVLGLFRPGRGGGGKLDWVCVLGLFRPGRGGAVLVEGEVSLLEPATETNQTHNNYKIRMNILYQFS